MQLTTLLASVLATAPFATASWPRANIIQNQGYCHESGVWGKKPQGIRATKEFCNKHKGKVPGYSPNHIKDSFWYNNQYHWDLEMTEHKGIAYDDGVSKFHSAMEFCSGNNDDTR